jgi:MarR family transcriptional regulator, negative regulator of the multidrug operon emrRAB
MSIARTANLLGAVALALVDAMEGACREVVKHGGEAAAALSTIGLEPGLTNQRLSEILGLSHPGTVRLLDKLVQEGLVERRTARDDARAVALHLSAAGEERWRKLLFQRRRALADVVERLAQRDQEQLGVLLEKVLVTLPRDELHAYAICRLCEVPACKDCPVERALSRSG